WRLRGELGAKVYAPAAVKLVAEEPDVRYAEGDELPAGLQPIFAPGPGTTPRRRAGRPASCSTSTSTSSALAMACRSRGTRGTRSGTSSSAASDAAVLARRAGAAAASPGLLGTRRRRRRRGRDHRLLVRALAGAGRRARPPVRGSRARERRERPERRVRAPRRRGAVRRHARVDRPRAGAAVVGADGVGARPARDARRRLAPPRRQPSARGGRGR